MNINASVNQTILKEITLSVVIFLALIVMRMGVLLVEAPPQYITEKLLQMPKLGNVTV